jgi:hypothetical protein
MSRSYISSPPSASMACSGTALLLVELPGPHVHVTVTSAAKHGNPMDIVTTENVADRERVQKLYFNSNLESYPAVLK